MAIPMLCKFSIYTIAHPDRLERAASRSLATRFKEAKAWKTGYSLWTRAKAEGTQMAVIFADATDRSRIVYWGILTRIIIEGKTTFYYVKSLGGSIIGIVRRNCCYEALASISL